MATEIGGSLRGRHLLVVEDDFLIADALVEDLKACGAEVLGPVADIDQALDLIEGDARIEGAVLDVNLHGEMAFPVADALAKQGIPHVFATGYGDSSIPQEYKGVPRLEKPVDVAAVARALFCE